MRYYKEYWYISAMNWGDLRINFEKIYHTSGRGQSFNQYDTQYIATHYIIKYNEVP